MATTPNPALQVAFPSGPLTIEGTSDLTPAWRAYFAQLYVRTGGPRGTDPPGVAALVAVERTARISADQGLSNAIAAEATTRTNADSAEAVTRAAADNTLRVALDTERVIRAAADALLVPIAQLCSMWAACDLSFLPTTDPGGGMPWLDGNHIAVGTSVGSLVAIGLEDGTGMWRLEDGTGNWIWG
jgi:hypothetical protein